MMEKRTNFLVYWSEVNAIAKASGLEPFTIGPVEAAFRQGLPSREAATKIAVQLSRDELVVAAKAWAAANTEADGVATTIGLLEAVNKLLRLEAPSWSDPQ